MKNNASIIYNFGLIVGDFVALAVAFVVAYILRVTLSHRALSANIHAADYVTTLLYVLPFFILIFALLGLYNNRIHEQRFNEIGRLFIGSFIGELFVISYGYITNTPIFPARLVTFYSLVLAFVLVVIFRTFARGVRREMFSYGRGINNVLVVGDTRLTHRLIDSLASPGVTGYRVLGVVGGIKHPHSVDGDYKVYSSFETAAADVGPHLHTIIQTELFSRGADNDAVLTYAQEHHVAYRFVPGNSELFTGNIDVEIFHGVPVIAVHQTALVGWGRVVKRLFDIVVSLVALVILSPLMLLIYLAVRLSDGGPAVFRQERLSRFDSRVNIYKFRSHKMRYNGLTPEEAFNKMGRPELIEEYRRHADSLPGGDPRVSWIGRILRRSKLDELPQLWNVLHGDISLVGPRALVAFELERYSQKNLILAVKSGLTGLAVVSARPDISFEERRKLDLYYVQNWTFWGDIVILIKSAWMVLTNRSRG